MRGKGGHRAGGFTLLELMVVAILMLLVAMMTAQMWRHFLAQAADLSGRSRAAQELRLALESLSDDLGSVVWATPVDTHRLLLSRRASGGQSTVTIEYALESGRLVRHNQSTGVAVPIADDVADFAPTDLTASVLQVVITVTRGDVTHKATLLWSRP